jgi:hypothetical protein
MTWRPRWPPGRQAADAAIAIDAQDHHAWRQKGLLAFMAQDPSEGSGRLAARA